MSTVYSAQSDNRLLPYMGSRGHGFLLRQHLALNKPPLAVSSVAAIENDLRRGLDFLHKSGLAHGRIDEDFVAIDKVRICCGYGTYNTETWQARAAHLPCDPSPNHELAMLLNARG